MRKLFILILLYLLIFTGGINAGRLGFDNILKSVVQIKVFSQKDDFYSPWLSKRLKSSSGTGFLIDKERILTNAHVISNARYIQVQRNNHTKWYEVEVLFVAHDCDLAILKAKHPDFYKDAHYLSLGDIPELNSPVTVVGYPIGGDRVSVTTGIVSRKEQSTYAHSEMDSHLVIQVDAAINPGNSGGPAIQKNKVVGVAFQVASRAENIGYLIPTTVIKHFLSDIKDGKYDGYVELGIRTINSFNPALRRFHKIPENMDGIFVTKVYNNSSAEGFLQKDDLIIEIDNLPIGRNGTIVLDKETRIDFVEVVDNKHPKENISLKIFRKGETKTLNFPAKIMKGIEFMRYQYDTDINYFVLAGLVFQPVSRDLLTAWNKEKETQGGSQFLYRFFYFIDDELDKQVDQDIILYRKLPHPINSAADYYINTILDSVNDVKIKNMDQFKSICNSNKSKFLKLKFKDANNPLILKAEDVKKADKEIKTIYNLEANNE
ncbi:MAG: trypsin-like peptidase domain-containing protein [Leptospiraceae bacterium]|nr:trypsin-like peptidase domain-containing protein [Leptospiraceae bacterium]MCP5494813.1 trypsin-like peptidase domain-containing protein [Leptospiraceae bacterium]